MNDRSKKAISTSALDLARKVLSIEADAVSGLKARLDERFLDALGLILACRGRVVVSGVGKSGHIARKIASTLASTGTPAFFVHAAEAGHGDLGMITRDDVGVALSNFEIAVSPLRGGGEKRERKRTRLNSRHSQKSYVVFCFEKKKNTIIN